MPLRNTLSEIAWQVNLMTANIVLSFIKNPAYDADSRVLMGKS